MRLIVAESSSAPIQLRGDCLLSGFYLNELLIRALPRHDSHPRLYTIYYHTLLELQGNQLHQSTLRCFEKKLLEELGYGLQLQKDFLTGEEVLPEEYYQFFPEQGFKRSMINDNEKMRFKGKSLLALANENFTDEECIRDAKRLMRIALTSQLGLQSLHSRKLFTEVQL